MPLISIITPVYNGEKFLQDTINSMESQTFEDFEWIIVDDCSTDRSLEIIQDATKNFAKDQIKIFKLDKNSGVASVPRNFGMTQATGKYIAFLDQDDLIPKNAFVNLFNVAEKYSTDILNTRLYYAYRGERDSNGAMLLSTMTFEHKKIDVERGNVYQLPLDLHERIRKFCMYEMSWNIWGSLFRRDFLIEHGIKFITIPLVDDMLFTFECLCSSEKYFRVNSSEYVYRIHSSGQTHEYSSTDFLRRVLNANIKGLQLFDQLMDRIPHFQQHPEDRDFVLDFFFELQMKGTAFFEINMKRDQRTEFNTALDEILVPRYDTRADYVKNLFRTANTMSSKSLEQVFNITKN